MITQYFRSRTTGVFQARSADRDKANDEAAIKSIDNAILSALERSKAERDGLKQRMDDVIARAAIVGGNGTDEHLTRDSRRTEMLRQSDADIRQGHQRLRDLDQNIEHLERVKATLHDRAKDA